jgi:hypothetical protein
MSMYEQFQTDTSLESQGIWVDYGDFRVRLARSGGGNKKFEKTMAALTAPYKRAIATETLSEDVSQKILMQGFVEAVILDWQVKDDESESGWKQGIEDKDGSIMPFNAENVEKTLKALPDLYIDLRAQAGKATLFLKSLREANSGN